MIEIDRNTLFDIIDEYERASTTTANRDWRSHQAYNTYLTAAAWAASQTVINDINSTIANIEPAEVCIDTGAYTIDSESLRRRLGLSPDPDTFFTIIMDDYAPQTEITEQELLDFLNGKDNIDANK